MQNTNKSNTVNYYNQIKESKERIEMKELNYLDYREIFINEMNTGRTIYSEDGQISYEPSDDEKWGQCYSEDDTARRQLPIYWFLSTNGNLISVYNSKARLLKKNIIKNSYATYAFTFKSRNGDLKTKTITEHTLLRIVFGGQAYGRAEDILNEKRMDAFNNTNASGTLNCHHIDRNSQNNNLDNLELLTTDTHRMIHKVPKTNALVDQMKFMEEFQAVAEDEEPNKISVIFTGQTLDKTNHEIIGDDGTREIHATDSITLSGKSMKQLTELYMSNVASSLISNKLGLDFFSIPRYLCIGNNGFYKMHLSDGCLQSEKINDTAELVDQSIIICSYGENNKLECCIPGEMLTTDASETLSN